MSDVGLMGARIAPAPLNAWKYPHPALLTGDEPIERGVMPVRHPVMDQWKGSCTINSSGAGLVSMSKHLWIPSMNAGYYLARQYSDLPVDQDTGAYPEAVAKMLSRVGLGSVSMHSDAEDDWLKQPDAAYMQQAFDHRLISYYRAESVEQVRAAVKAKHAVMVSMAVTDTFGDMRGDGMWRTPGGRILGGHQQWLYAFDDAVPANENSPPGAFSVLQSWGAWGEVVWDHPQRGRGSWRLPYTAVSDKTAKIYDIIIYTMFDATAGD